MSRLVYSLLMLMRVPASLARVRSTSMSSDPNSEDFSHGLECPKYENIAVTSEKYHKRRYESAKWVSTQVLNLEYDEAASMGFRRLFGYISGENDEGKKIEMTAPVATRVIPGDGPACESNFTISFFVPFEYQSETAPPNPTNPDVTLVDFPELTVYVKIFGGRARERDWLDNADKLSEYLTADGLSFEKDVFYTACYDSPYRFFDRHNEIWFIALD